MDKSIKIDLIIKKMEQELGVSLQHIGKVLGRFFPRTLWDYYSAEEHDYPAVKTPEELLQFINEYYTTALLWPCYRGMIRAKYYSKKFLSQFTSVEVEGSEFFWNLKRAVENVKGDLLEPWDEYIGLLAFDKKMLKLIKRMSFKKVFVQKWVKETESLYWRINRSNTYVSPCGWTLGLKSRQEFVDRYVLGDRSKFYGKLRKDIAKELNVPIKDLSELEKSYGNFWRRWLDNETRFYDKYYWDLVGTLGLTVQVDASFWIESDYYALLLQEIIAIIKELLKQLEMEYSHKAKIKLVEYFRNYFGEWEYWSFRGFMSWCEKVRSGTMSLEIPLPSEDYKERAERERKHKDDLEYHKQGFVGFLNNLKAMYEILSK